MDNFLLALTVSFSAARTALSKKISVSGSSKKQFFFSQLLLFLLGALVIFSISPTKAIAFRPQILPYSLVYGIMVATAQGMYTKALRSGNTSICSLLYSFGFLIPTISGALFWQEPFGVRQYIGVFLAAVTICLSAYTGQNTADTKKAKWSSFFLPLLLAMLCSGGLGILQKIQQKSEIQNDTHAFLLYAFFIAIGISAVNYFRTPKDDAYTVTKPYVLYACLIGLCFGGANYINTFLAGRMSTSVFFPVQNIAAVLLSTVLGMIFFKEKLSLPKVLSLLLGIVTIFILKK